MSAPGKISGDVVWTYPSGRTTRCLMAAVLRALRASGFTTASLWVLEDNPRARRFYEREGWTRDGGRREEEFLGVPVAEIRYRFTLG
jgi:RimJ/RimL family protein N-acetyltransferase